MAAIRHLLKIAAKPDEVYRALTTGESIRDWWPGNAERYKMIGGPGIFRVHYTSGGVTWSQKHLIVVISGSLMTFTSVS